MTVVVTCPWLEKPTRRMVQAARVSQRECSSLNGFIVRNWMYVGLSDREV